MFIQDLNSYSRESFLLLKTYLIGNFCTLSFEFFSLGVVLNELEIPCVFLLSLLLVIYDGTLYLTGSCLISSLYEFTKACLTFAFSDREDFDRSTNSGFLS